MCFGRPWLFLYRSRPFAACGKALQGSYWFMLEYKAENATTQAPCIGRGGVYDEQEALATLNTAVLWHWYFWYYSEGLYAMTRLQCEERSDAGSWMKGERSCRHLLKMRARWWLMYC